MLTLFDDIKNPVFRELCRIVNEIGGGKELTRKEILERIFFVPELIYAEFPDLDREKKIIDTLFRFNRKGFAEIPPGKNFSLSMTDTELCWLSALLADDELFFLLPATLREKLSARLKNFPPLYEKKFWRRLRTSNATNKIFADKLSVAVQALILQKKICDTELLTPCRLEYDLSSDKYFLIAQRVQGCFEKIPIEDLKAPTLSGENIPRELEEQLKNFYAEHVAEVTIKVKNTRNAVERCFALFSSFDKKSRLQEDDGTYFLTIRYCTLDEEEIFEKVFSLGATVIVIEPKEFRERVIKKFSEIRTLYG